MSKQPQTAAPWWKGAVIYQIYPRSFLDADGDGVGDLKGILKGLDHVADLGVDGVWLSPFFTSPMRDFGYDVADYKGVDPIFGTLADFDAVVARAHALGLKLIIDQVYSHTSDQHAWFAESRASKANAKAGWYVWADAKPDGSPPNNWLSVFGGPAWEWDKARRQYYLHNFLAEQPDLNFHNPDVRAAILETADFWLSRGVDGFRLDVINYCTHDALLRDNPPAHFTTPPMETFFHQRHVYNCSRPENLAFVRDLRARVDAHGAKSGEKMLVGEIFDDDSLGRQREYSRRDLLHTAYSFHLLTARKAVPSLFADALTAWSDAAGWPSWSLGNHDVPRFPTRLFGDKPDPRAVKLALAVLLTLRGTIFLYQGEELGLPQANVAPDRVRDPHSKRNLEGAGRDGARTPLPWRAGEKNAGFSAADATWLPLDPRHGDLAIDRQRSDPASVLSFLRAFLKLRRAHPALVSGEASLVAAPDGVLAFRRSGEGSAVLCVFNLSENGTSFPLPGGARILETGLGASAGAREIKLPAFSGALAAL